jgi:hypothetical protein
MKPDKPAISKPRFVPPSFDKRPMSLSVNENLMAAYCEGNPLAVAVIASWKFHEPIVLMAAAEYDSRIQLGWGQ